MQVYIDGSHSFCTSRNTGIERVVRMLAHHLQQVSASKTNENVHQVIHCNGVFTKIEEPLATQLGKLQKFEANPNACLPAFARWGFEKVASISGSESLRKLLLPGSSHLGIYSLPYRFVNRSVVKRWASKQGGVAWNPGDVLLMPDAYWTKRDIWETVQKARESGVRVVSIFYDLIPLTHPEYVGERRREKFLQYVHQLVQHSDLVLAISKTVRDELRSFVRDELQLVDFDLSRIGYFKLGANFADVAGTIRPEIANYFQSSHEDGAPYIVVGSLDPRKNHVQTLDAFERMHALGRPRRLCFIGRTVGNSEVLMNRMRDTPLPERWFTHLADLSDAELQYAYRNCQAVIMPSMVEGFGLPIVEALWHGSTVLASDIPVHREVGGEMCEYFPLHDPEALMESVQGLEDRQSRSRILEFRPTTWDESASQVLSYCTEAVKVPA